MSYTTNFSGEFTATPALNAAQVAYLKAFNGSRRMKRDATITAARPDPKREAVYLPIGDDAGYFVGAAHANRGQEDDAPDILDYNSPPSDQPGLWCQWVPSDDGATIVWDEGEKFYNYVPWIEYLIEHFLAPWGVRLSGRVAWQGEDNDDRGTIHVKDNHVQAIEDQITAPEPEW